MDGITFDFNWYQDGKTNLETGARSGGRSELIFHRCPPCRFQGNVTIIRVLWDPHPPRQVGITENTLCGPLFHSPSHPCCPNLAFDYRFLQS